MPAGRRDLVVVSELLYFLSVADIEDLAGRIVAMLDPGGVVLLANWTGPTDTPCTGDAAVAIFAGAASAHLQPCGASRAAQYRIDLWERAASR